MARYIKSCRCVDPEDLLTKQVEMIQKAFQLRRLDNSLEPQALKNLKPESLKVFYKEVILEIEREIK